MVLVFDILSINLFLRPLASFALIILWIKLFYFMRVFESNSQLIRMIIEIVKDMKNFLIVLLIGIIALTGSLFIMQQSIPYGQEGHNSVGDNMIKAFIYTYRLTLGDLNLDDFDKVEEIGIIEYYILCFIFIFGSLFLVIVMLNLLIAIVGSTYEKI
jgi:hypothetical protein